MPAMSLVDGMRLRLAFLSDCCLLSRLSRARAVKNDVSGAISVMVAGSDGGVSLVDTRLDTAAGRGWMARLTLLLREGVRVRWCEAVGGLVWMINQTSCDVKQEPLVQRRRCERGQCVAEKRRCLAGRNPPRADSTKAQCRLQLSLFFTTAWIVACLNWYVTNF